MGTDLHRVARRRTFPGYDKLVPAACATMV
jgi:hypothetical protein